MVGALDTQTAGARRARTGFRLTMVFAVAAALVLSGCGDDHLFRNFSEQSSQPNPQAPGPDAGDQSDSGRATPEELRDWYDSQDEIIAPWAHELDQSAIDDAVIEEDRVSWPLPEYDYMKAWAKHDLLWSPVSDPSRAFLRRVLDIAITDDQIIFQTRTAGLNELYFKSHLEIDATQQQELSPGDAAGDGQTRTRRQELKAEINNQEVKFSLPKRRFGLCTKAGSSGFEPCMGSAISCPGDYEDSHNLCDKVDPQASVDDDSNMKWESLSAEASFGTYIEFEPRFQLNFYRVYLVADFNGWGNENDDECNCISRYYDTDVDRVASYCGMSVDDVVDWKAECSGETVFANLEIGGGASIELHDFKWKINKTTTISKKFTLFKSLPIPLGAGIGVTMDVAVPITFNLETLGEMHWTNAANGPKFGVDFGFGYITPAGPRGSMYELDIPDNNATSIPSPEITIQGKASVSAGIEAGALIGFLGSTGAKLSIGAKAEAGVSAGSTIDTGTGTTQAECTPFFKLGGTLAASLIADIGVWSSEKTWPIFDTCANPNDNLFDLDLRAACLSWGGENLCNNVYANQVRLVARDANEGGTIITSTGERVDPSGIEIDAIYAVRGSGDSSEIIKANFVQGGSASAGQNIGTVGFDQCAHGTTWESNVGTFQNELIVGFEEPLQPGDKIRVFRQGFPLNMGGRDADGNVVYCRPSGIFDVYVGDSGQWGQIAGENLEPDSNVHDINLSLRHFPQ